MPIEIADTDPKLTALRELIKGDLLSWESSRTGIADKVKLRKEMYNSELPKRQYKGGRANTRVPFPYTFVETMVPRYMASIFVGRDVLDVLPRHVDAQRKCTATKTLLNYQLMFEANFFWESYAFFKTLCATGYAVMKIRWNNVRQCPELVQILPEDYAQDPRAPNVTKAAWVAHKTGLTADQLNAGVELNATNPGQGFDAEAVFRVFNEQKPTTTWNKVTVPEARGTYEVWEWWGEGDIGNGQESLIAYFCGNHLLSAAPSPYKTLIPFIAMADVPDPIRFSDSKSELDSIESLYEAASDILNQRLDNVTLNINGFTTVRRGAAVDTQALISTPWGVHQVEDHDDIKRWDSANVTQNAYQEVGSLLDFMKMSTGLQDFQRGASTNTGESATGANRVFEAANMRPGLKVKMAQFLYLKRVGEIFLTEDQMFMAETKQVLVLGEDMKTYLPKEVNPDMIAGLFDVMPLGFDIAGNRDMRISQMISLLNTVRGIPAGDPAWPLVEEIVNMAELKSGDKIIQASAMRAQAMAAVAPVQQGAPGLTGSPMSGPGVVQQPGQPPIGLRTPMGAMPRP